MAKKDGFDPKKRLDAPVEFVLENSTNGNIHKVTAWCLQEAKHLCMVKYGNGIDDYTEVTA